MLQISTKKFFKSDELEETLHRGTFFTNYRIFGHENYETISGRLLPSSPWSGLITLTCETTERLEKYHADGTRSPLISVGSADMLQDFAAITSFILNVTCTIDPDLTRRLIAKTNFTLGSSSAPQKYLTRVFDTEIHSREGDDRILGDFIEKLMGLDRTSYEASMRAIRRYVVGTHRISDDIDLAYTLFVASIESLAQQFDGFSADWSGLSQEKRLPVDEALTGTDEVIAARVREAVLRSEHRSLARRYKEFSISNVRPSFFRAEADGAIRPIKKADLAMLLEKAYAIRSKYVHQLREIPRGVSFAHDHGETVFDADGECLAFQGIARLSRHIILNFIDGAPRTEKENFHWRGALPNIQMMPLASQYWVWKAKNYNAKSANKYLSGFLDQIAGALQSTSGGGLNDMREVLAEAERIAPGLKSADQRRPLVLLYYLYNAFIVPDSKMPGREAFFARFGADLDEPSVEQAIAYLANARSLDWDLADAEKVYLQYYSQRRHARGLKLNSFFESALTLAVAALALERGNVDALRRYLTAAVENNPGDRRFLDLEEQLRQGTLRELTWQQVLIPQTPEPKEKPND